MQSQIKAQQYSAPQDACLSLNGQQLVPLAQGALYWPARACLIVSDLHFEKGSAMAARGLFLPPTDTRSTLARLEALLATHEPKQVIALGDSFHDSGGAGRMLPADQAHLFALVSHFDWVWITGNHDPLPPAGLPGRVMDELVIDGLTFRHEAVPDAAAGEISGHFHPKAKIKTRARAISRPCFVVDDRRIILPAFGSLTGGLSVRHHAIARLFGADCHIWLTGGAKALRFPLSAVNKLR